MSESAEIRNQEFKENLCENVGCPKPDCKNQDPMQRGPNTSRPMSEFKDGNGCTEFGPKLIGTVNMGDNSVIDLKIARTGVRGNKLRTDRCAAILEDLLDQSTLDRHALRVLR